MNADQVIQDTQLLMAGHKVCPTCPDARPQRCCSCGTPLLRAEGEREKLAPDPYDVDILGVPGLHLQCRTCLQQSVINARDHLQERED